MTLTMFCSGSLHHTIMLFDWEIDFHVCSTKFFGDMYFLNFIYRLHTNTSNCGKFQKMELLFNVKISDL